MKNHFRDFQTKLASLTLSAFFLLTFSARSQPFQIVWGMNRTLSGSSSSTNFTPYNANLIGAHPHSLPAVLYYLIGTGDYAYGTTYWQALPVAEKYLTMSFSVNTFEYNLTSISFRVRRSPDGPTDVALRSSLDGFSANLSTFHLTGDGLFYTVNVPLGLMNLSTGITFRIDGTNANTYLGVMYFDQIIITGTIVSIVLPIALTYFNAKTSGKTVLLEWETASEQNSGELIIERSQDLESFSPIGTVTAAGESQDRISYSFVDEAPLNGVNYYRLKMVDQDGLYNLSQVRDAVIGSAETGFTVSPNPASPAQIRVHGYMLNSDGATLTDMLGRNIPVNCEASGNYYLDLFPKQTLSSGLYVLSLNSNGKWQHQKVLIP
jgi:hypothetical protein